MDFPQPTTSTVWSKSLMFRPIKTDPRYCLMHMEWIHRGITNQTKIPPIPPWYHTFFGMNLMLRNQTTTQLRHSCRAPQNRPNSVWTLHNIFDQSWKSNLNVALLEIKLVNRNLHRHEPETFGNMIKHHTKWEQSKQNSNKQSKNIKESW